MQRMIDNRDRENGTASLHVFRNEMKSFMGHQTQEIRDILAEHLGGGNTSSSTTTTNASTSDAPTQTEWAVWMWAHNSGSRKYTQRKFRFLPDNFRLSFNLLSKKRKREEEDDDIADGDITQRTLTVLDAWTWYWEGLQWNGKKVRPLVHMSKDPKFHFKVGNARNRYNDLHSLVTTMCTLLEGSGVVDCVEAQTAARKVILFPMAWKLMVDYIRMHHPKKNKRAKDPKQNAAFTTMKKDYAAAATSHRRQQQLVEAVKWFEENEEDAFLRNAHKNGLPGWDHEKEFNVGAIETDVRTFTAVYIEFLDEVTTSRKGRKQRVTAMYDLWKRVKKVVPAHFKEEMDSY